MTNEEFVLAAQQVINDWEQKKYNPPNLARNEHNANCFLGGIYSFAVANKRMPTAEEFRGIVESRGDLDYVQLRPAVVNPADNLPHDDGSFPMLQNIRTLTDVQNLTAADARKFLQPGAPHKEFTERIAYIRAHQITESTKPYSASKTESKSTEEGDVQQARALVANLKISDVGSSNSSVDGGKWTRLHKTQDRLTRTIDSAVLRKVAPERILQYVTEEIGKLGNRSIT